jgi:hypothetical protein
MKLLFLTFAAACLFAATARAADTPSPGNPLEGATELGVVLAKGVSLHDACVQKGLMDRATLTAKQEFDRFLTRTRTGKGMPAPEGITAGQMGDAIKAGFDFAVAHIAEKPLTVNEATCSDLAAHWSGFAQNTGLEVPPTP